MINNCLLPILLSEGLKKIVFEIEEIDLACGAGDGGVEPPQVFLVNHLVGEVALVYDHGVPLPALGFMAGEGIGEFCKAL